MSDDPAVSATRTIASLGCVVINSYSRSVHTPRQHRPGYGRYRPCLIADLPRACEDRGTPDKLGEAERYLKPLLQQWSAPMKAKDPQEEYDIEYETSGVDLGPRKGNSFRAARAHGSYVFH